MNQLVVRPDVERAVVMIKGELHQFDYWVAQVDLTPALISRELFPGHQKPLKPIKVSGGERESLREHLVSTISDLLEQGRKIVALVGMKNNWRASPFVYLFAE